MANMRKQKQEREKLDAYWRAVEAGAGDLWRLE
jgi:hypothetical protein